MTLNEIYDRAQKEGIEIDDFPMRQVTACSFPEGWIAVNPRKVKNDRVRKRLIAHEMGHIETGAFYNDKTPLITRSICERKAEKRAVELLVPLPDLIKAIRSGTLERWELAEKFDVPEDMIVEALQLYENRLLDDRCQNGYTQKTK
mgnify:CR=1 FL=1